MEKIRTNVAGIDIGAKKLFVSVEGQELKTFLTFTEDIGELCKYLLSHSVKTVAMEATGVYWCVLYEMLEESGIDVWLVDGRETKQAPGRKTDAKDCQWIQELHSYGLLKRCFVASEDVKELRAYHRLREDHLRSAAMHVNQMQKALTGMNLRLKEVLCEVHGTSGQKIISAILQGERDKEVLLRLSDPRIIKNKRADMLKALTGRYTDTGLFALRQAWDSYHFYQKQIADCDKEIENVIRKMNKGGKADKPAAPRKPIRHNKPQVKDLGQNMVDVFDGKDATVIPGITDYTWMQLLSETGRDLGKWQTEKHFTSWLGLSPGQHWSGKMRRNKRKNGRPKAGQIFRQIAQSLIVSKKLAIGEFGRRLRSRKGPAIAIKAMARKVAQLYWRVMVKGLQYAEAGINKYKEQLIAQKQKSIQRLALELGVQIVEPLELSV
jgi:transposase